MKQEFDLKTMFQALASILVLAIAGWLLQPFFQDFSFYLMEKVSVQTIDYQTPLKLRILFCVALAFIPILFLAMDKMFNLSTFNEKLFAIAAILVSGIGFWQFKINSLNTRYEELSQVKNMHYYFALEDLHLELYLLMGFIVGAALAGIGLYRYKKRG